MRTDLAKCITPYCRKETKGNRKHCSTCRTRRSRENNPFQYFYSQSKHNALRRGKTFDLTLEEFKTIWKREPEKWQEKLTHKTCTWEMDRIREDEGYHFNNIQLVKKRFNIQKYIRWYQHQDKDALHMNNWIEEKNTELEPKAPF